MSAKVYLNLLILCGAFFQGIIGTLSEGDINESSELLSRQKRVINHTPGGDQPQRIINVPYIVFIREFNHPNHCPGTILTKNIAITVAKCVLSPNNAYRVYSGTSRSKAGFNHQIHGIVNKRSFHGIHPFRTGDGVALIAVHPPFVFSKTILSIPIFQGDLRPGTFATVSGWGCHEEIPYGTEHPESLRSIIVPIISVQECANIYLRMFAITEADICTLDRTKQQYCTVKDSGAPLVVEFNGKPHLAGIHLWNGGIVGRDNPDVFINLQDRWYKPWISDNIRSMEESLPNHEQLHHLNNPHIRA